MTTMRLLIASLLVAALAGCSSDTPPSGGGAADSGEAASIPDPCSLVSADEVARAVGTAVSDGSSDLVSTPGMPTGRSCRYEAVSGPGELDVMIWPSGPELFQAYREQERSFGDVHDVPGVGDVAFRSGWTGLTLLKGDYLLTFGIELAKYDPDLAQNSLKALALTSIGRL